MSKKSNPAFYHPETGELLQGLQRSLLSLDGRFEYPDPVPLEPPVSTLRPAASGMRQLVQELIRQEMSELADAMDMETFEESDDFDIEDDPVDPHTPYEAVFDPKDKEKSDRAARSGGAPVPSTEAQSAPPVGGAVSAPPTPTTPLNDSAVTTGEPNVKRSEP